MSEPDDLEPGAHPYPPRPISEGPSDTGLMIDDDTEASNDEVDGDFDEDELIDELGGEEESTVGP